MIVYQSQIRVQCACHLTAILCHDLVVGIFLSPSHPDHKTWSREIIDFSFFDQLANFCPNFHLIVALPIFPLPWSVEDTGCGTAHQQPWPLRYMQQAGQLFLCNGHQCWFTVNQLEKLEAARSAYFWLPLFIFGYLSWPYWAFLGLTVPYWALLGLTVPYWALLDLTGPY